MSLGQTEPGQAPSGTASSTVDDDDDVSVSSGCGSWEKEDFDESIFDSFEADSFLNPPPSREEHEAIFERLCIARRHVWTRNTGGNECSSTGVFHDESLTKPCTKPDVSVISPKLGPETGPETETDDDDAVARFPSFPESDCFDCWHETYFRAAKVLCDSIRDPCQSLSILIWINEEEDSKIAVRVLSPGKYGGIFLEDMVPNAQGTMVRRVRNNDEVSRSDNSMMNYLVGHALDYFNWGEKMEPVAKKRDRVDYQKEKHCDSVFARAERKTVAHPIQKSERMVEISFFRR